MTAGRPTDYQEQFVDMAYVACKEGGFTDVKLAKLFNVSKSTIANWKNEYPEFLDSIKKGKDEFNLADAEDSQLKLVKGHYYYEITKEPTVLDDKKLVVTKKVRKYIPPNPTSLIFFLKNRDPERWRDKQVHEHEIGKDTLAHAEKLAAARARKQKTDD